MSVVKTTYVYHAETYTGTFLEGVRDINQGRNAVMNLVKIVWGNSSKYNDG